MGPAVLSALWRVRAHCKCADADPITAVCNSRHQVTLGVRRGLFQQQNSSSSSNQLKVLCAIGEREREIRERDKERERKRERETDRKREKVIIK
jgi:hypothetical protein